jgi:hypothetical protein
MAVLEGRLTGRYLWELEKQEKIDAARAIRQQKVAVSAVVHFHVYQRVPR